MARISWSVPIPGGTSLGKHDDVVSGPVQELVPPALPAHRCTSEDLVLILSPQRSRQGEYRQGEQHVHSPRSHGVPRRMFKVPLRFGFFDIAVLNESTVVVVIRWLRGLVP